MDPMQRDTCKMAVLSLQHHAAGGIIAAAKQSTPLAVGGARGVWDHRNAAVWADGHPVAIGAGWNEANDLNRSGALNPDRLSRFQGRPGNILWLKTIWPAWNQKAFEPGRQTGEK
jgi:hypothetical protein